MAAINVKNIILTVTSSITEVFILCIVGYVLSIRGVIDERAKKQLNRLNVSLFTPALMFSKVAFTLTPSKLADLYIIPIGFVIITSVSMGVAWILCTLLRLSKTQRNFAIACSAFQNSNSLPIALMQSLIYTIHKDLAWSPDDTKDAELGRALSYLVVYSTLGLIARWSFGVALLRSSDSEALSSGEDDSDATPNCPLLGHHLSRDDTRRGRPVFHSFPSTPHWRTPAPSESANTDVSSEDDDLTTSSGKPVESERRAWGYSRGALGRRLRKMHEQGKVSRIIKALGRSCKWMKSFMTPPLYAALLSIFVACIPPLQRFLSRLEPLRGALKNAGNVSVPLTLVVLGAYFNRQSSANDGNAHDGGRPEIRPAGERRTIFAALFSRHILTPLVLLPALAAFVIRSHSVVDDDPCFVVVAVLLVGSPIAVTMAQMTASTGPAFERLVSKTLLYSYAIFTPPTTVALVVFGLLIDAAQKE